MNVCRRSEHLCHYGLWRDCMGSSESAEPTRTEAVVRNSEHGSKADNAPRPRPCRHPKAAFPTKRLQLATTTPERSASQRGMLEKMRTARRCGEAREHARTEGQRAHPKHPEAANDGRRFTALWPRESEPECAHHVFAIIRPPLTATHMRVNCERGQAARLRECTGVDLEAPLPLTDAVGDALWVDGAQRHHDCASGPNSRHCKQEMPSARNPGRVRSNSRQCLAGRPPRNQSERSGGLALPRGLRTTRREGLNAYSIRRTKDLSTATRQAKTTGKGQASQRDQDWPMGELTPGGHCNR